MDFKKPGAKDGALSGSSRFLSIFDKEPETQAADARAAATGADKAPGFFDSVLFALTGPDDASLTPEQLRARNGRRAEAGQLAASYKNPGRQFMQPVSGGGGSAFESIGKIVQLLGVGGG